MRSSWKNFYLRGLKSFREVFKVVRQLENTVQLVFGLGLDSSEIKSVDHEVLWLFVVGTLFSLVLVSPTCWLLFLLLVSLFTLHSLSMVHGVEKMIRRQNHEARSETTRIKNRFTTHRCSN